MEVTKAEMELFDRAKKANITPREEISAWGKQFSYVKTEIAGKEKITEKSWPVASTMSIPSKEVNSHNEDSTEAKVGSTGKISRKAQKGKNTTLAPKKKK